MIRYRGIDINVIPDKDATVASVIFEGKLFTASSRRRSEDKYAQDVGVDLAVSRLFAKIARHLARRANGAVKHHDDMRREHDRRSRSAIPYTLAMPDLMEDVAEHRERVHRSRVSKLIKSLENSHTGRTSHECGACQQILAAQAEGRHVMVATPPSRGRHAKRPRHTEVPFDWRAKLMEMLDEAWANAPQR